MTKARFLAERREGWKRLERLVARAGTGRLRGEEISELSARLRAVSHDLAMVRSRDWGAGLEADLNDLVVRGHAVFYGSRPRARARDVVDFYSSAFPRLLRANAAFFWLALALFAVPFAASWIVVQRDPALAASVLPSRMLEEYERMYAETDDGAETGTRPVAAAAGFYVRHNTGIAFRVFALGILAGLGTMYVLVLQGLVLGTVAGYVLAAGHGERFLSFVVSHGSFELTAIVVAGAAGLVLGHAVVTPGCRPRAEALRERGLVAVRLALGAAGMLAVAAVIEGFWSPSSAPPLAKYVAGALLWTLVAAYLLLGGRRASAPPRPAR